MANNQYVNKVQYGDTTLVDLTSDTVTESTLMAGYTAHDASGAPITGIASPMSPYTSDPAMDGTASAGSSNDYARGDHVHPTDTSRAATSHAHGDITSGGDITASSATVAPGDCIVINDDSENKITNGPAFGSDTTKFLRNDGT